MGKQLESIQSNLSAFSKRWKDYSKNERQGYQTFLLEFFECFGISFDPNKLPFEKNTGKGFADAYIKDIVIVEMKDKSLVKTFSDLEKCIPQALRYWEGEGKHVPFLVLCNFHDFIIFDTRDASKYQVKLGELDFKSESFNFLLQLNPTFIPEQEEVSKKSAKLMGKFYTSLKKRLGNKQEEVDLFVLQCLFCLFSEDIGYLPAQTFTNCVRKIKFDGENSADILSTLFKMMDESDSERKKGRFENVKYFNGPLFRKKPELVLKPDEVDLLWQSCELNWQNVRPEIFGALFESTQSKTKRHRDGMHFTNEEDILNVVKPCILDPWNEQLSKCKSLDDLESLHSKLKAYRVLDPACGSGNFLVVAYRELKSIEYKLFMEYRKLSGESYADVQKLLGWIPVTNMYGIEINAFPSFLTQVSLWIAKKLIRNKHKLLEKDLPLQELKHVIAGDALQLKWNDVDVVIGNPPYIGCKQIRKARGDDYFEWLSERFTNHNKMSDYCTYWFEKVLEDVKPGSYVGLVCTKTISQTNSREASLDKVVASGGTIFNAISRKKWSGEAKVTVSIVNFVHKGSFSGAKYLDGKKVSVISTRLKSFNNSGKISKLNSNKDQAYVGPVPNGKGFVLTKSEAETLLADKDNQKVIKKYLIGEDILHNIDQSPSRYIIDFQDWSLEESLKYSAPYKIVEDKVKPVRKKIKGKTNDAKNYRKYWWKFGRPQMGLRKNIESLSKFICVSRVSKYPIFVFVENKNIVPSDSTVSICFDSYDKLGVLQSRFHTDWYNYQCSTLEGRFRYTNTTVFETFPFPSHVSSDVSKYMKQIEAFRSNACRNHKIGLTSLYNKISEGGFEELSALHKKLDKAVAESYGFPYKDSTTYKEIIDFITDLNKVRAEEEAGQTLSVKAQELSKKSQKKGKRKSA